MPVLFLLTQNILYSKMVAARTEYVAVREGRT